jgi:hypothetical protein
VYRDQERSILALSQSGHVFKKNTPQIGDRSQPVIWSRSTCDNDVR